MLDVLHLNVKSANLEKLSKLETGNAKSVVCTKKNKDRILSARVGESVAITVAK